MSSNDNLAPTYLAVFCTLTAICVLLVALRFWVRRQILRTVGSEDWFALLALCLMLIALGLFGTSCHYGLGQHISYLTQEQTTSSLMFLWIAFNITPWSEIIAKISITLMLIKITTSRTWKNVLISLIVVNVIITISTNFTILLSCKPLPRLWDSAVDGQCHLSGRNVEVYIQGSEYLWSLENGHELTISEVTAAVYDLILAFSPVILLWKVQISTKNKFLLCGLFALGCVTAAVGIARVTYTNFTSWSNDPTWEIMPFVILKCVGIALSIIVGCLPTLRPLFNQEKVRSRNPGKFQSFPEYPGEKSGIMKTTEITVEREPGSVTSSRHGAERLSCHTTCTGDGVRPEDSPV